MGGDTAGMRSTNQRFENERNRRDGDEGAGYQLQHELEIEFAHLGFETRLIRCTQ